MTFDKFDTCDTAFVPDFSKLQFAIFLRVIRIRVTGVITNTYVLDSKLIINFIGDPTMRNLCIKFSVEICLAYTQSETTDNSNPTQVFGAVGYHRILVTFTNSANNC